MMNMVARAVCIVALWSTLLFPVKGAAFGFYLYFDFAFNGPNPTPTGPWVTAIFEDVVPGTVRLTITNTELSSTEKVNLLAFNLNPAFNPNTLIFTHDSSGGSFTLPAITTGANFYKADGDGKYDIKFAFNTANDFSFMGGQYVVYTISGIAGLQASDFAFLSAPGPGSSSGPFFGAGHILGIPVDQSTWIAPVSIAAIPEPPPVSLIAMAGGIYFWMRSLRRSRRSAP